jgi:hypothetical protein
MSSYSSLSLIAVGVVLQPDQVLAIHDAVVRAGVVTTRKRRVWTDFRNVQTRPSFWNRIMGVPAEVVMGRNFKELELAETQKLLVDEYSNAGYTDLGELTPGVGLAFDSEEAKMKNSSFFIPDMVSMKNPIAVQADDDIWEVPGVAVSLHGNGYLFPWTLAEVRIAIRDQPILQNLVQRLERLIPIPVWSPSDTHRKLVENCTTWTPASSSWVWALSQSM